MENRRFRRFVDMWAVPGIHPTNVEFLQRLKSADTSHFTRNMQVVGTASSYVEESGNWEKDHLIGIRTDVWKQDKAEIEEALEVLQEKRHEELRRQVRKNGRLTASENERLKSSIESDAIMNLEAGEIESRRLVLKLFRTTGKRTTWAGSLEQMTATEIHNSIGSRRSLITLSVMLPRYDLVTTIQQNHRTMCIPPIFTFCFLEKGTMFHLGLKRRWVSFGPDFDITANGKRLGMVNGRMLSMGTDSEIELEDHELSRDTGFGDLLTLFAASMGYHRAMWRSIARRVKAAKSGQSYRHVVEDEELRLHHNGRSAA